MRPQRPHLIVVWIGLGLATADAATRRVPEDHATIGDALAAAGPGDVVDVACGTYFEHDLELKSGVVVRSRSRQAGCVTVDAQELGRVAVGSDLEPGTELQGLTLVNGVSPVLLNGGALHLVASSLLLNNCELKFNRAEAQYFSTGSLGGAIYAEGGETLDVQECRFEANRVYAGAGQKGGAIYCAGVTEVRVDRSTFLANDARGGVGGAIAAAGGSLRVSGTEFRTNRAAVGGALHFQSADADIRSCTFDGNRAFGFFVDERPFRGANAFRGGGAVDCLGSDLNVADCTFANNEASSFYSLLAGGAVNATTTDATFRRSRFTANAIDRAGGILAVDGPRILVEDCVFSRNVVDAPAPWGTLELSGAGRALVTGCTFHANTHGIRTVCEQGTVVLRTIVFGSTIGRAVTVGPQAPISLGCADLFGNAGGDWTPEISHQLGVDGNIYADPAFCTGSGACCGVSAGSPCLPGNHPDGVECGAIGTVESACADARALEVRSRSWGRIKAGYADRPPGSDSR